MPTLRPLKKMPTPMSAEARAARMSSKTIDLSLDLKAP